MNDTLHQLYKRKSVRVFEEKEIPCEEKQAILRAAIEAPTAGNMTLYSIIDITDQSLKDRLAITCDNQPFIATAPIILIFCADYHRWYEAFCAHIDEVRKPDIGDLNLATADAIIAAQNAVVAAQSLGIGSCYIGDITENYEIHKQLLSLPKYVVPAAMLCFGYPTEQQKNRAKPLRFQASDIVHENAYHEGGSAKMDAMLMARQGLDNDAYLSWLDRFCQRKWNSEFSEEMSRSCREMTEDWCK